MDYPEDLKYTNDHEWLRVEGSTGTIGISAHAAGELGDVVYVDISSDLTEIRAGETFGTIEAVKTVADINDPVSGRVIAINHDLNTNPEVVNNDPYGDCWMIKVEMTDLDEIDFLLDVTAYKALIGE